MEQLLVSGLVNTFLSYLTDIVALIYVDRPQLIPIGKIDQKILWELDDLSDIRWSVIDSTLQSLSFKSFAELNKFSKENYGFPLTESRLGLLRMNYIFECRNAIVHNRGIFTSLHDNRLKASGRLKDTPVPSFVRTNVLAYLVNAVDDIDMRAAQKFGISLKRQEEIDDWLARNSGLIRKFHGRLRGRSAKRDI